MAERHARRLPDSPDFDQIALRLLHDLPDAFLTRGASASSAVPGVAEQLRLVWNARGAADIEAFKGADIEHKNRLDQRPDAEDIRRAIRALDR